MRGEYFSAFSMKLTVLFAAFGVVLLISQSNCDEGLVDELNKIVDDESFSKDVKNYLDVVPTSHKARSAANRIFQENAVVEPDKKGTKLTVTSSKQKNKTESINFTSKSYPNLLGEILEVILSIKDVFICEECSPCPVKQKCKNICNTVKCNKCPPCKLPDGCRPPLAGAKCPPEPDCSWCKSTSTSKNAITPKKSVFPPDILSEVADLLELEEGGKMNNGGVTQYSNTTSTTTSSTTIITGFNTTNKPKSTTSKHSSTTHKPVSTTKKPIPLVELDKPSMLRNKRAPNVNRTTTTSDHSKIVSEYSDDQGNVSKFVNESSHNTFSQFIGTKLFYKNLDSLKLNDTTRKNILNMIQNIPQTVGGEDSELADRLLTRFGEKIPTVYKKKDMIRRRICRCQICPPAPLCGCLKTKCAASADCPKCPTSLKCFYPPTCKNHGSCFDTVCKRPRSGPAVFNDDGPIDELDDIDPVNPVTEKEEKETIPCNAACRRLLTTCGEAPLNKLTPRGKPTGYMVGGADIEYGEFPSFVRLSIKTGNSRAAGLCGGTLISDRHVLTAGHCVQMKTSGKKNYTRFKPDAFTVYVGDFKINQTDKAEQTRKVSRVTYSSKFNIPDGDAGTRYDYAILTMDKKVNFSDYVMPACLPLEPLEITNKTICYAIGVGITKYDKFAGHHQFSNTVQRMRVDRASCKHWGFKHDDRSRHCFTKHIQKTGDAAGDSCGGDSGGPILCINSKKRWTLMGMVSYGSETCDGSETSGWVAVYTRVRALLADMIKDSKNQKSPLRMSDWSKSSKKRSKTTKSTKENFKKT